MGSWDGVRDGGGWTEHGDWVIRGYEDYIDLLLYSMFILQIRIRREFYQVSNLNPE